MESLVRVKNVSKIFKKWFQKTTVLTDINFTIEPGEFVILKGQNGSGKTTLLNTILGLIEPTNGAVELMGYPSSYPESKSLVGVVLQETSFPKKLKVRELTDLFRCYYSNPISTEESLNRVSLIDKQDSFAASLSGGQKQRLLFALALIGNPQLLILDEPTRNLDKEGYEEFWNQIKECKKQGVTILMVTNNKSDLQEVKDLATRYLNLQRFSADLKGSQLSEEPVTVTDKDSKTQLTLLGQNTVRGFFDQFQSFNVQSFKAQIWSEVLQVYRTPIYLVGVLLPIVGIIGCMIFKPEMNTVKQFLIGLCSLFLFTFCLQALPGQISSERAERWLKLIRATPLSSITYILSKVFVSLSICMIVIMSTLAYGNIQFHLNLGFQLVYLVFTFLIVAVPTIAFSLIISYLVDPKAVNGVNGLSWFGIIFISGLLPLSRSVWVENAILLSPVYHAQKLISFSAGINNGQSAPLLHFLWLCWASFVLIIVAVWAYRRDSLTE